MRELVGQLIKNMGRIDFNGLWKGFHRTPFALYDDKTVYFENSEIARDERFFGNTAILYEGSYLAICKVEGELLKQDAETLTADLVHEMFHAYQYENSEKRFPHDLITLRYPYDTENFNFKYAENQLLADAFEATETAQKRQFLNQLCGLRQKREDMIGEMIECEYLTETAEGMAEYVGTLALKALSEEKYNQRCKTYIGKLRELNKLQLDIRRISYYSGAVILLTASTAGIDFEHAISAVKDSVWRLMSADLKPELPEDLSVVGDLGNMREIVIATRAEKENEIEDFIKSFKTINSGDFTITGYDPMNMLRIKDYILCKTFVRLENNEKKISESLMGQTLLEMAHDSENRVIRYFGK